MGKCAVFCSQGLGDGLLFLLLSENLQRNGYEVDTYHPSLAQLQEFFPNQALHGMHSLDGIVSLISSNDNYERVFFNLDSWNAEAAFKAKETHPDRVFLLKPTTCKGKNIYRTGFLEPKKTLLENLCLFCKEELHLSHVVKENGMQAPAHLEYRKNKQRIAIHPTSRDPMKNWPKERFLHLKRRLEKEGFEPFFVMSLEEKKAWGSDATPFASLVDVASFIYESSYFIGNDSGLGHLASSLHITTLTLFSTWRKEMFWRPDFFIGLTVKPPFWLPNWKGLGLQEEKGKEFIFERAVLKQFYRLKEMV
ncbi:Glycosyltransferase family 9 (heptosyltransferase) [uncultured archaeon]|nr:Glycosyltransferase family 9 (heptosyltransferase) [uncultured archaeon]